MMSNSSIFSKVVELENAGDAGALCTIISNKGSTPRGAGTKMLVYKDGNIVGTVGGGELENRVRQVALEVIAKRQSRLLAYNMADIAKGDPGLCGGQVEVYVEPILPKPSILVIGGGHVGKAVSHLAKWLGFRVIISDDRPEFCTLENNPDADIFLPIPMSKIPEQMELTKDTYIVLTTRGVSVDIVGLPALIASPASYIGVIGSRKRWATTVKALEKSGIPSKTINRIHSPIGLELNAETPEEIATSILSEIIMIRNGGTGKKMKMGPLKSKK